MVRILSCIVLLLLIGCKSASNVVSNSPKIKDLRLSKVIKKHDAKKSEFNTLKGTLKVNIVSENNEDNVTVDVRIIKDSLIWMSFKKWACLALKF